MFENKTVNYSRPKKQSDYSRIKACNWFCRGRFHSNYLKIIILILAFSNHEYLRSTEVVF